MKTSFGSLTISYDDRVLEPRPWTADQSHWAAEILAEARLRADRIARETERVLREHGELWDDMRAQMDSVQSRITALRSSARGRV